MPYSHPDFARLFPCTCRSAEREHQKTNRLFERSNLSAFHDKTFATFNPDIAGVRRALLRSRQYAQNPQGWLVLFGKCGVGKTHLAAAIANEIFQHKTPHVIIAVVPDLLDHLRSTFGPSSERDYDETFATFCEVEVLVLDDFGTQNTTAWAREKLYQIINHRYNYALATVITTNHEPHEIDERIFSRMSDRALSEEHIIIDAEDYRRLSLQQRFPVNNVRRRYQ
ncbi:MAG TPA: ATP-binding protein [Roseiflexaceae bacterium]|nr:ATP-binding protein [Roseiflexaceae bacterium]